MNITMQQSELKTALAIVSRAVPAKPVAPVNGTIKFIADGSIITMQATDYSISISHNAICQSDTPGMAALPAQRLNEVVNALPGDALVSIDVDADHHATIKSGKAKVKLSGFNPDDFPSLPEVDEAQKVVDIPSDEFLKLLQQGGYCYARDMSRPVLNAVQVDIRDGIVRVVSADGFHMAMAKVNKSIETDCSLLMPGDMLAAVASIIDNGSMVSINATSRQVIFSCDDTVVTSRTVDGQYPDMDKAIGNFTSDLAITAQVDLQELKKALRLVGIFTPEKNRKIVSLEFAPGFLKVYSSGEAGEGETEIACKASGEEMIKHADVRYMADVLSAIDTPIVIIKTGSGRSTPIAIHPDNESDVIGLVMPVTPAEQQ